MGQAANAAVYWNLLPHAVNMAVYFFGVITIPWKIKSGDLDLYITKPVNTLFHISFENIDIGSVPLIFASLGIIVYAVSGMNVQITFWKVSGYLLLVDMMLILYYDMEVIMRTIPFFVIQTSSIDRFEGEAITLCMKIPGTLFKGAFKVLFYLVLPYGINGTCTIFCRYIDTCRVSLFCVHSGSLYSLYIRILEAWIKKLQERQQLGRNVRKAGMCGSRNVRKTSM